MSGPWRVGRKLGRTLYIQAGDKPSWDDKLVGMMDTSALARDVCDAMNHVFRCDCLEDCAAFHGQEDSVDPLDACGATVAVDSEHSGDAVPQHDRAVPSVPADADLPVVELDALGDQPGSADA